MADLITDEMVETFAVTGTYATIGRQLKERYAGLLDRTSLYQPWEPGLDDPRLARLVNEFNGGGTGGQGGGHGWPVRSPGATARPRRAAAHARVPPAAEPFWAAPPGVGARGHPAAP